MNAPFDFRALETPLKPVLDPRVYVEPKDRDPASEIKRQGAWVRWMHRCAPHIIVFATRNGAHIASVAGRNKAKMEGLHTGFPDNGAIWPGTIAVIEWKDGDGDPSDAQIECLNRLVEMGFLCGIFRTRECANRWLIGLGAPIPVREGL